MLFHHSLKPFLSSESSPQLLLYLIHQLLPLLFIHVDWLCKFLSYGVQSHHPRCLLTLLTRLRWTLIQGSSVAEPSASWGSGTFVCWSHGFLTFHSSTGTRRYHMLGINRSMRRYSNHHRFARLRNICVDSAWIWLIFVQVVVLPVNRVFVLIEQGIISDHLKFNIHNALVLPYPDKQRRKKSIRLL